MTIGQQNQTWINLPKEVKESIREIYWRNVSKHDEYSKSAVWNEASACWTKFKLLEDLFGRDNIISNDNELEEMLYVKRSEALHLYENYKPYLREPEQVVKDVLEVLFGLELFKEKQND